MSELVPSLLCPSQEITKDQLVTDLNLTAIDKAIKALNRRRFLGKLAASGAAFATSGLIGFDAPAVAQGTAPSIVDVLNFALNLEFLEANLYASVTGQTPPSGGGPVTNAPAKLTLDDQTMATAAGLYNDEVAHIGILQQAILSMGGTPVSQPAIDLSGGGTVTITTQAQFLAIARQFTAVGNSAYAGAAQFLVSDVKTLKASAQILGAEAQHLGAVNYLCALQGVMSPAVDAQDYPPIPPNTFFTVTPIDGSVQPPAAGPVRDTSQVLGIVYGVSTGATTNPPAGVTKGGFFPNGVNGTILST